MFFQILLLVSSLVILSVPALPLKARAPAACLGFRLTSPVRSGLVWTYGECYSADWDLGASQVTTISSIQLVNAQTKQVVATEIGNIPGPKGNSGNFPLLMGDDINQGDYYFQINGQTPDQTCSVTSATFRINIDPNSPPVKQCPP